jgi:type IV pilus assembly protein PilA
MESIFMKRKKNLTMKGFTLIELLVVISIILILMGFVVPKFSGYQDKAKTTKAINAGKQIETAAMASYGENEGQFLEDNVEECIEELTTAENPEVTAIGSDGKSVNITYTSDDKNYQIKIDADNDNYLIREFDEDSSHKIIFSNTP